MEKRRRISLTIGMKKELCRYKDEHPSAKLTDLYRVFSEKWNTKVGMTTIREILQKKDKWYSVTKPFEDARRIKPSRYHQLEEELYELFLKARNNDEQVTDAWLRMKARAIGKRMKLSDLRYSKGWLNRFKKRYFIARSSASDPSTLMQIISNVQEQPEMMRTEIKPIWSLVEIDDESESNCGARKSGVNLEEAKESLVKVIAFISDLSVRDQYLHVLVNLLNFLNTCHESSEDLADTAVKVQQEDATEINSPEDADTDRQDSDNLDLRSSELVEIKQENICNNGEDQCTGDFINDIQNNFFDVANCIVSEHFEGSVQQAEGAVNNRFNKQSKNMITQKQHNKSGGQPTECQCNICGGMFSSRFQCQRHIRSAHVCDKPFRCLFCDKSFAKRHALTLHNRTHTGEKPYLCTVCGKGHAACSNLIIHMRSHSTERPFSCQQCNKSYKSRAQLFEHQRVHSNERPFKCSMCSKTFKWSTELTMHKRQHTGERPFKCILCGMSYIKTSSLKLHMRKHTGEKPYTCQLCDKSFSQKSLLTSHLRIHTGERPFCCAICGKRFSQGGSLYNHRKMHRK